MTVLARLYNFFICLSRFCILRKAELMTGLYYRTLRQNEFIGCCGLDILCCLVMSVPCRDQGPDHNLVFQETKELEV